MKLSPVLLVLAPSIPLLAIVSVARSRKLGALERVATKAMLTAIVLVISGIAVYFVTVSPNPREYRDPYILTAVAGALRVVAFGFLASAYAPAAKALASRRSVGARRLAAYFAEPEPAAVAREPVPPSQRPVAAEPCVIVAPPPEPPEPPPISG